MPRLTVKLEVLEQLRVGREDGHERRLGLLRGDDIEPRQELMERMARTRSSVSGGLKGQLS